MSGTEMYESGECERRNDKNHTRIRKKETKKTEGEESGEAQIAHKKK